MKPLEKIKYATLALLLGGAVAGVGFQSAKERRLREELGRLRVQSKILSLDLSGSSNPREPSLAPAEGAKLRADRDAAASLRREIASLQERREALVARQPVVSLTKDAPPPAEPPRSITNSVLAPSEWKQRGAATPTDALETALWAGANGEIEALMPLLGLDGEARSKAEALLGKMASQIRAQYASPERLVALLSAKEVPLGGAQIMHVFSPASDGRKVLAVKLVSPDGSSRITTFNARPDGTQWKLTVPVKAVEAFEAMLTTGSGETRGGK